MSEDSSPKIEKALFTILGTLITISIAALVGNAVRTAAWQGVVSEKLAQRDLAAERADMALDVGRQHGAEFNELRERIRGVDQRVLNFEARMSSMSDRTEEKLGTVTRSLTTLSTDRFTGSEWLVERALIIKQIDNLMSQLRELRHEVEILQKGKQ